MNKTLLTLFIFSISLSISIAQNIVITQDGVPLSNDQTIVISGQPTDPELQDDFIVTSLTPTFIDVRFVRYEVSVPGAGDDYFCWSACYPPFSSGTFPVWEDGDLVSLDNHTTNVMSAYYVPNGSNTSAQYRYVLYDDNNPSDSISLNIIFDVGAPVSVTSLEASVVPSVSLFPNPSEGKPNIKIRNFSSQQNSVLQISNMLGETVYQHSLANLSKLKTIDLSSLESGLYFYSVLVEGRVESTQRLIVK